jgi:arylsulfatase
VTCEGVVLRARIDLPAGALLDLSLTALGTDGGGGTEPEDQPRAVVEVRGDRKAATLLDQSVRREEWTELRLEVPELSGSGPREVLLRSSGPVAWAELFASTPEPADEEFPSLILISLDTVRADHLSLYGYERTTTPWLDRFARQSLVFTRSLSSSSWTLPSTATLLTGLLPAQHGVLSLHDRLAEEVPTLAERLRERGYRTAALTDGGFAGFRWGLGQGFHRYDTTPGPAWNAGTKDAARTFSAAADWVRRNRHRPFFLFLHSYEARQPYQNREGFGDRFLRPGLRNQELRMRADPRRPPPGAPELQTMIALYDGELARADHYLGAFLRLLEEPALGSRVGVLVTSDHGEEFLEHGDLEHAFGKVFDSNVMVPLVLRPPGGTAGRRIDTPASGLDVVPTLLDMAGLPHDDLPGRSLLDLAGSAGAGDLESRAILVHGLPSFPGLTGARYRLDEAGESVILDGISAQNGGVDLLRYESTFHRAEPWDENPGDPALPVRLGALLAWQRSEGLLARLPDDAVRVSIPEGSRVGVRGVWTGRGWREWPGVRTRGLELAPRPPHVLAFEVVSGRGWELLLARAGTGGLAPYRLTTEQRETWDPFAGRLPMPGSILVPPTSSIHTPEASELDRETFQELQALGYLR